MKSHIGIEDLSKVNPREKYKLIYLRAQKELCELPLHAQSRNELPMCSQTFLEHFGLF